MFDIATRVPAGLRYALGRDSEKNAGRPDDYPHTLVTRERVGMMVGPVLYLASRLATRKVRGSAASTPNGHDGVTSAVAE